MQVTIERDGGVTTAAIAGKIDGATSQDFHEKLLDALEDTDRGLVLDMEMVDYISSAGLRVVLLMVKRLSPLQGKVVLCRPSETVREAFLITGFDKLVEIRQSR